MTEKGVQVDHLLETGNVENAVGPQGAAEVEVEIGVVVVAVVEEEVALAVVTGLQARAAVLVAAGAHGAGQFHPGGEAGGKSWTV